MQGRALKLSTFKVGELVRGRKIGELFLKAAFRYATESACEHVFLHGDSNRHGYLIALLEDFGFRPAGSYGQDSVLVKAHPRTAPQTDVAPAEYARLFFPHFREDASVKKYLVPIKPRYHGMLFPDYVSPAHAQMPLFRTVNNLGNAIKLAYLCHTPTKAVRAGDVLVFYRTQDEKAATSLGVVDRFEILSDASRIASLVSRRTVYSEREIEAMANRETKVILFRHIRHFPHPVPYDELRRDHIVTGPIQSLKELDGTQYRQLLQAASR